MAAQTPSTPAPAPGTVCPPCSRGRDTHQCWSHSPSLLVHASSVLLVLSLSMAQGVRLHPSQVKPIQELFDAAQVQGPVTTIDARTINCTLYLAPALVFTLTCNDKGYATSLYLGQATFTKLPRSISGLQELTSLSSFDTSIGGPLPASLGRLPKLKKLFLARSSIRSKIPPSLGNLKTLQSLHLEGAGLVGPIPSELGKLTACTFMIIAQDSHQGPIPQSFKNLTKIKILNLSGSKLNGSIPEFLQTPKALSLSSMDLSGNYLLGSANGLCSIALYSFNCLSAKTSKCKIGTQRSAKECRTK